MSTSLTAVQRLVFPRGDTWSMLVDYLDPATGLPNDTTGSIVTGLLALARNVRPITLTVGNGGLTIDPVTKRMRFVATPAVTSSAVLDPVALDAVPATYTYPNRLIVIVQDSAGDVVTRGILPVLVCDARNIPIGAIPLAIVSSGSQGPAGASGLKTYALTVASPGQTVFGLPTVPSNLTDVGLIVDGKDFRAPYIAMTPTQVTWNGPFQLDTSDDVFIRFA